MRVYSAFNLDPIRARMFEARVSQAMLQTAVIGKEQQAFAVVVEASGSIDSGHLDIVRERFMWQAIAFTGELA